MSNHLRRLPLLRRPAQVADPGEMVDLRMEEGSWREGFWALFCAPRPSRRARCLSGLARRTSTRRLVRRTAVRLA